MPLNNLKTRTSRTRRSKRTNQNERFKRTINLLSDAVLLLDRKHKIVFINSTAPRILGLPRQALLGKPLERVLVLEELSSRRRLAKPPSLVNAPVHLLATVDKALFNVTAIDIHRTPGFNQLKSRAVIGLFIRPSDVTLASTSNVHQQIIGQITMRIAHDFNNSLTSMLGNAELVQEFLEVINSQENNDPETFAGQAIPMNNDIIRKCVEMAATIKKLQEYAHQQTPPKQNIDLNLTINETLPIAQRILGSRLSLEFNAAADLPPIVADQSQLHQLLFTLFDNCKERAGSGRGVVSVNTALETLDEKYVSSHPGARAGVHLRLLIKDHGECLPKEAVNKPAALFTPSKTDPPHLAMVYAILKQLGAYLHVDSSLDLGTRFAIYFPLELSKDTSSARPPKPSRPGANAQRPLRQRAGNFPLILIAEDQPDVQQTMVRYLSKAGYETEVISSGVEALQRFREPNVNGHEPCLVIADLGLPGMDGRTLCRKIKEINPHVPVLLTSGHAIELDEANTKTPDGIPFIHKPFDSETIMKMISALLR